MTEGKGGKVAEGLVETFAEEHDEIMGIVQALRHFATFAFGHFLAFKRIPILPQFSNSSPIYRLELAMVGRLFAQDPSLCRNRFHHPPVSALLEDYVQSLHRQNLGPGRARRQSRVRRPLPNASPSGWPFSEQALRESTFLVEQLVHRF